MCCPIKYNTKELAPRTEHLNDLRLHLVKEKKKKGLKHLIHLYNVYFQQKEKNQLKCPQKSYFITNLY